MISSFKLKAGRNPGSDPEAILATPVTVFVGPNNSGKSRVLQEILAYCRGDDLSTGIAMIAEIVFEGLPKEKVSSAINRIRQSPVAGHIERPGHIFVGGANGRLQVSLAELEKCIHSPGSNLMAFRRWYLQYSTLMLGGQTRIGLTNQQDTGDLQNEPVSSFQVLFKDRERRLEVRRIVQEAFGRHFVLDPTYVGKLRIRLSDRPPQDELEECGIHAAAVKFHADSQLIHECSDGVKAFTGIITEVMAGDPHVILVDEPEAFLHPSLAFKLGQEVSRAAKESNKRVFASTHSSHFLLGCIQSGVSPTVVRLTYQQSIATTRILPSEEILALMRHPLLRSTGVIGGLFYEFVVVAESDSDRAFYQEINERLLQFMPGAGIPNCLFLNAQNKQTVHTLLRPLRKLGIPAAGIVDIDVVKDGGANWTKLLSSADFPEMLHASLGMMRVAVKSALEHTGLDMKRGGLQNLTGPERRGGEQLLDQLQQYGIFVVPDGELESWLKFLGVDGHGPSWLVEVFEKMGNDPSDSRYLRPSQGDVWGFITSVKNWLVDPSRKGIPN